MKYKGFEYIDNNGQIELRLILPEELERHFFAWIYCRANSWTAQKGTLN